MTEPKDTERMKRIVDELFPTHPTCTDATDDTKDLTASIFIAEELTRAAKAMKVGKAPGPDGISGGIIRLMVNLRSQIFLDLYNTCLTTGTFSD